VIVGALAFGGIGAADAGATVLEGESLSPLYGAPYGDVIADGAAAGGRTLRMLGSNTASGSVTTGATSQVVVRARGDQCVGAPALTLAVDGRSVLTTAVADTSYSGYAATVALAPGDHQISVAFTNDYAGPCDRNLYVDSLTFSDSLPEAPSAYWSSTFAGTQSTPTEWTVWYPATHYGAWGPGQSNQIDTPASFGIPAPSSQISRVARFWHAADDPAVHHKLYKSFSAGTWPAGQGALSGGAPADVSGRYISEFYIDTSVIQIPCGGQLMQFKEDYLTTGGVFHDDAAWGLNYDCWLNNRNDINMQFGGLGQGVMFQWDADQAMNRWITIELRVYQWDRIEIYVDGALKGTARSNGTIAVGRTYFPPGSPQLANFGTKSYDPYNGGGNVTSSVGYTLGTGNYTTRQSLVYLGRTQLLPLP
jgi:hypothetical protein